MAETLGSLSDKLIIVKLKILHSNDNKKKQSLLLQEKQLQEEIDSFLYAALTGEISPERLKFSSNKVYKKSGNRFEVKGGSIGLLTSELAETNYSLWREQEKVYDFENVPIKEKDFVMKRLAHLNLKRNHYIDQIDEKFQLIVMKESDKKSTM